MKKQITITIISAIIFFSIINLASALIINSVSMDPSTIEPGEKSTVTMSLKNNGDNDLTDISINLDLSNVPIAPADSGSQYNFNELNSDKTKEANFEIIAQNDAKSGIYKIPVSISYKEDDVLKTQQSVISVTVNSEPIIEVSYEDSLLLKGQKNPVTIKVINKGLGDSKFLEIELGSSTDFNIISQNKIYIGDIDSNDFQTQDFQIYFNPGSQRNIDIPVNVKYKDVANKEYNKNFDIQLKVYTREQAQNLGLVPKDNTIYIVLVVIVLIVVFFVYRMVRKRKRQNEIQ